MSLGIKMLEYYYEDGTHVVFSKYTIDTLGIIKNIKTGRMLEYGKGKYNIVCVCDDECRIRSIRVSRAIASTFLGEPPTLAHTADHIKSKEKRNDALANIRWATKPEQRNNRIMPDTLNTAFIVVKDDVEKTKKEWIEYLKEEKNPFGNAYTDSVINHYAQKKQYGFAFKEYPDIDNEVWLPVKDSINSVGRWEISNMCRVKYITNHASNVLSDDRLGLRNGYPAVGINGILWDCHVLAFKTFFPDLWAAKKEGEMVLHEKDDRLDFRPEMLRLGTRSENMKDAYDNGKHEGTKSARMKCASYVNGEFEKEHESQGDAAEYLKTKECSKSSVRNISSGISQALTAYNKGKTVKRYGRTWKTI
jgi:hypothetical protein